MANYDLTYEGSRVQGILDTGNSLKDAGYIFRGEATPSTVPGTPTERVAYIGGPGTYTNFGSSITVPVGRICVFKYTGSAWSNQVIETKVSDGAAYKGIATPTTNPGSPICSEFYIAVQAGTYTNFGRLAVTDGINILKYNGSTWSVQQAIGIDAEPTQGSANLVKSGGVLNSIIKNGPAFDLSAYNAQGGVLATYADLSAALTALNALPADFKKGGMSMKFVLSSDNKYVQFRLMSDSFNTTPDNWQGVDYEPIDNSKNLVESGGIYIQIKETDDKIEKYKQDTLSGTNYSGYKITENGIQQIDNGNCYVGLFAIPDGCRQLTIKGSTAYNGSIGSMAKYAFVDSLSVNANILLCSEMLNVWTNFEEDIDCDGYEYIAISGFQASDRNLPSAKANISIMQVIDEIVDEIIPETVAEIDEDINKIKQSLKNPISPYQTLGGKRIANGSIVEAANSNWVIRIYRVAELNNVTVSGSVSSGGSLYALMSSPNTNDIISVSEQSSTWQNYTDVDADVTDANYIAVCYYIAVDRTEASCTFESTYNNTESVSNYKKLSDRLYSQKKGLGADVWNFVDCLQIVIVTDVHGYGYAPAQNSLRRTIQCANKMGTIDAIFVLGDIPMGDPKEGSEQWYFNIMNNALKPIYPVVGNHCVGNSDEVSKAISHNEAYTMWIEPFESNNGSVNPNDKCYYYKDFTEKKIRLIALYDYDDNFVVDGDTYSGKRGTYVYGQTQLQWLADTLYSTPSDYGVVIIKHEPIDLSVEAVTSNKFCTREEYIEKHRQIRIINNPLNEGQTLPELINAYINGTDFSKQITTLGETFTISKDFSNRGEGEFICYLGGHTHLDMVLKSEDYNQYQFISQSTTPTMKSSTPYPPIDQYRDDNIEGLGDAINIVTFDRTKKLVKLCRVGVKDVDDGYLRDFDAIKL